MKRVRFYPLLLAALFACSPSSTQDKHVPPLPAKVSGPAVPIRSILAYVEAKAEPERATVKTWKGWTDTECRVFSVLGIEGGAVIGCCLAGALREDPVREKRMYLLEGWRMSPQSYVASVDDIIRRPALFRKNVLACFVRAEAEFASLAGQRARAERLQLEALRIELHSRFPTAEHWHYLCGRNVTVPFAAGILEGIAFERACIRVGVATPTNAVANDTTREEMDRQAADLPDDYPLVGLYLRAWLALIQRAQVPR